MEDEEKAAIKEVITHLGGRYTAKMSRNNSHLIVDRAVGQKWANAAAFGAKAVTTAWLIDSARTGKLHCPPFTADQLLQCAFTGNCRNPLHIIAAPTPTWPQIRHWGSSGPMLRPMAS
jgi:hypothetical protein